MTGSTLHSSMMTVRCLRGWAVAALLIVSVANINAQSVAPEKFRDIYKRAEPCVVQMLVTGVKDGRDAPARTGTGFIVRTTGGARVITAGHVVGTDSDFDLTPGTITLRQRDISLRVGSTFGTTSVGPFHAARVHPEFDIAQVYLDKGPSDCLLLSNRRPILDDEVIVLSWSAGAPGPQPRRARVLPGDPGDGVLFRLDAPFQEGESGSPILDEFGNVTGVLITKNVGFSAALPIAALPNWIPDATYAAPLVARMEITKRSGNRDSGTLADFSSNYELCSDPIPTGSKIVKHDFHLEGDRSCGAWSECKLSREESSQVCYAFRMQGHNELPAAFTRAGVRQSEGVLKVTYEAVQQR